MKPPVKTYSKPSRIVRTVGDVMHHLNKVIKRKPKPRVKLQNISNLIENLPPSTLHSNNHSSFNIQTNDDFDQVLKLKNYQTVKITNNRSATKRLFNDSDFSFRKVTDISSSCEEPSFVKKPIKKNRNHLIKKKGQKRKCSKLNINNNISKEIKTYNTRAVKSNLIAAENSRTKHSVNDDKINTFDKTVDFSLEVEVERKWKSDSYDISHSRSFVRNEQNNLKIKQNSWANSKSYLSSTPVRLHCHQRIINESSILSPIGQKLQDGLQANSHEKNFKGFSQEEVIANKCSNFLLICVF